MGSQIIQWFTQAPLKDVVSIASVGFVIATFLTMLCLCKFKKIPVTLQDLIASSLAASALPTALVIMFCAVDTSLLYKLGGLLQIYIAISGLVLAYVSVSAVIAPLKK
tara:strand:- start:279 stop:602 length:324 start_codon:yes stop_codon:yes gene_type:complete